MKHLDVKAFSKLYKSVVSNDLCDKTVSEMNTLQFNCTKFSMWMNWSYRQKTVPRRCRLAIPDDLVHQTHIDRWNTSSLFELAH